jgi:uncharacterized Fe-S cluster protein YjdI/CDGSH-type Zn-finger protein
VQWDSTRCIHTALCLMTLPAVFDVARRPWVNIDAADPDAIARAVEACPTGALRYRRLDGGPQEQPQEPPSVVVWPNGPLLIRGRVRVGLADGTVLADEARLALCRCGGTRNPPFCDNTHRAIRFRSNPRVIAPERADANSPQDIATDAGLP